LYDDHTASISRPGDDVTTKKAKIDILAAVRTSDMLLLTGVTCVQSSTKTEEALLSEVVWQGTSAECHELKTPLLLGM
jgi:hypothetical protein